MSKNRVITVDRVIRNAVIARGQEKKIKTKNQIKTKEKNAGSDYYVITPRRESDLQGASA